MDRLELRRVNTQQAQNLDQVTTGLDQIEQVTQQVASGAEESSAASEELSSQAQELRVIVTDLVRMVHGARETSSEAKGGRLQLPEGEETL